MNDSFKIDFIVLGAAKSGTSWLAACLKNHPQICLSKQKELNFFCAGHMHPELTTNFVKGYNWLRTQFPHWTSNQLRGEISPSYLVDASSPELIYRHYPNVKLVVMFRNPVDALNSFYFERAKYYKVPQTFEQYLIEQPHVINFNRYYDHLQRFLQYFPMEQFHFIFYDDIQTNPHAVLSKLFDFFEIDNTFVPPNILARINVRMLPKSMLLRNVIGWSHKLINASPHLSKIKALLSNAGFETLIDKISVWNLEHSNYEKLKPETEQWLIQRYDSDVKLLSKLLKRDLSHWIEQK